MPIAESLREAGVPAMAVDVDSCPAEAPYQVVYSDRWAWDMRTYLSKMTIEVIEAATGRIVAYGESLQASLDALGQSHRDIINRAVPALVEDGEG